MVASFHQHHLTVTEYEFAPLPVKTMVGLYPTIES